MCCANALDAAASRRQATAVPPQKDESHFPFDWQANKFILFSPKHIAMGRNQLSPTLQRVTAAARAPITTKFPLGPPEFSGKPPVNTAPPRSRSGEDKQPGGTMPATLLFAS